MEVTISTDSPLLVFPSLPVSMTVEVQLFRDGLNGKSAYELAVESGYTGTLEEFIANQTIPDVDYNAYYILSKS